MCARPIAPTPRPDFMDITPENSALLVIDMSCDFLAPNISEKWGKDNDFPGGREAADRVAVLLDRCRELDLPVIYINHVHTPGARDMGTLGDRFPAIREGKILQAGSAGVEMWEAITPQDGDLIVNKIRQSGFPYTRLEAVLSDLGVSTLIVSGVSAGACVECTARDGVAKDFNVVMLSDGTSGASLPDLGWGVVDSETLQNVFLTNFAYHFGRVASVQQLLDGPLAVARSATARAARARQAWIPVDQECASRCWVRVRPCPIPAEATPARLLWWTVRFFSSIAASGPPSIW